MPQNDALNSERRLKALRGQIQAGLIIFVTLYSYGTFIIDNFQFSMFSMIFFFYTFWVLYLFEKEKKVFSRISLGKTKVDPE